MTTRRALILAAHGSRHDAEAVSLVQGHAEALRGRVAYDEVHTAFHHGTPTFADALGLTTATDVTVVPLFTSAGWFTETVLPRELRRHPRAADVSLRITAPLGAHAGISPLLADRVRHLLHAHALRGEATSVVVAGHGTKRHVRSRATAFALADHLRAEKLVRVVETAFIDDDPALDMVLDHLRTPNVLVLPFFIGGGSHARMDVPEALGVDADDAAPFGFRVAQSDGRLLLIDTPLGALHEVRALIEELARPPAEARTPVLRLPAPAVQAGRVTLVSAGPGDPGLITVKGLAALRSADVVVYDRLANAVLLNEAPPHARLIDVGKAPGRVMLRQEEIGALLVAEAQRGGHVVRLKGGDAYVFGRGSEETAACEASGIHVEVIPGVSSALAGPAAAGIPVTARGLARSFTVMTGHQLDDEPGTIPDAPENADTLVVLMGRASLGRLVEQLLARGRDAATPVACVENATLPEQRVLTGTLADIAIIAEREDLQAPMVMVIGAVAALARASASPEAVLQAYAAAGAAA